MRSLKIDALPGLQPGLFLPRRLAPSLGREHRLGIFQLCPTAVIEVVEMMIVAEEHIVEYTHSLGTKRRVREFAKRCRFPTGIRLQRGRMSGW